MRCVLACAFLLFASSACHREHGGSGGAHGDFGGLDGSNSAVPDGSNANHDGSLGNHDGSLGNHDGSAGDLASACGGGPCCWKCNASNLETAQATCTLDVMPQAANHCPDGYSTTPVACDPCWDCRVSAIFCPTQACCGDSVDTGTVANNCTCYSCQGFALGGDMGVTLTNAETWSHAGGPPPNPSPQCIWPSSGETVACGFYPASGACRIESCGASCGSDAPDLGTPDLSSAPVQ